MLTLQIRELCALRGIKAPLAALMKAGISQQVSSQYLNKKKKNLLLEHIEILCTLLRCTPSDLFAWEPNNAAEDYADNSLQKIRKQQLPDLQKVISGLSLEEVRERLG